MTMRVSACNTPLGVALLMPMWLFSLVGVDFRLPHLIICLVVAGTSLETKNRPDVPALAMMTLLLFGGRTKAMVVKISKVAMTDLCGEAFRRLSGPAAVGRADRCCRVEAGR